MAVVIGILAAIMKEARPEIQSRARVVAALAVVLAVFACTSPPTAVTEKPVTQAPPQQKPSEPAPPPVVTPQAPRAAEPGLKSPPAPTPPVSGATYKAATFAELPGWRDDAALEAWPAFVASCGALVNREGWREVCTAASRTSPANADSVRRFFERHFRVWQVASAEGAQDGLITGYYEPLLRGSRKPGARYRYPLYTVPDDLINVDLAEAQPDVKGLRLRGRLEGRRIVPYYDRAQIESGAAPLKGKELLWVDDPIDLFFLHVQGSGRIALDSGETVRVGYADQNGYPYKSIGRTLIERGELTLEQASMQGIKAWAREHAAELTALLNTNPSYVFFRELPGAGNGPPGSLGVPLTPRRSVAVDTRYVPAGAPVYIATTWPNSAKPMNRLMLAQDTGSAIRGAVRADFFWGYGEAAAREAGRMKQRLKMWLLLPTAYGEPRSTP
ncbi:MAG TPA: MltA domain-containing protein [Burkholderiales bacterium]|nr:MltA domain-containing protein [Burkholderiales bacterium]